MATRKPVVQTPTNQAMNLPTHQLDKIIESLIDIKWQLKNPVSIDEFEDVRNKLLDARELIRSIMESLNTMDKTNENYEDKVLNAIIKQQNIERQKIHNYFLGTTTL